MAAVAAVVAASVACELRGVEQLSGNLGCSLRGTLPLTTSAKQPVAVVDPFAGTSGEVGVVAGGAGTTFDELDSSVRGTPGNGGNEPA